MHVKKTSQHIIKSMAVDRILKHNAVKGSANIGVTNSVNGEFYSGSSYLEFISKCSVKICNSKDAISH